MTIPTDSDFIEAMEKAVALRGEDYIYPKNLPGWQDCTGSCVYSLKDGTPACIVGVALSLIDPDLVPAYGWNDNFSSSAVEVLEELNASGKTDFSEAVMNAAMWAQQDQDRGLPWGESLHTFYSLV